MGIIHISVIDIIDIVAVALLMYYVYRMARKTNAMNIISGIIIIYLIWVVTKALNMELLSAILGNIIGVGVIAMLVIFQPEIRQFLQTIGLKSHSHGNIFSRVFNSERKSVTLDVTPIVDACLDMSASKTGALIVIQQQSDMSLIADTGIRIDAVTSKSLIKNLFFKNSPLHDGAVVVKGNRIVAARCVLPSTQSLVPKSYGMRHRAALGMSEMSDAVIAVVSEETGGLSIAHNGFIQRDIAPDQFKIALLRQIKPEEPAKPKKRFFSAK